MKLLTETEVAAKLEVTRPCLRRWRHEQRGLPFVRVGRLVRYRPEDLAEFIEANIQPAQKRLAHRGGNGNG